MSISPSKKGLADIREDANSQNSLSISDSEKRPVNSNASNADGEELADYAMEISDLFENQMILAKVVNDVQNLPSKMDYLIQQERAQLDTQIQRGTSQLQSKVKELESYIQSLHQEVDTLRDQLNDQKKKNVIKLLTDNTAEIALVKKDLTQIKQ